MRKIALSLVMGLAFVGAFAQTTDPVATVQEINAIQTKAFTDARANNTTYDAVATNAAMKAKAEEAIKGVDVAKIDASKWSAWSRLFDLAGKQDLVCKIIERYLEENKEAKDAHSARMTMANACFQQKEDHMLAMTLRGTKPVGMESLSYGNMVGYYSSLIEEKQGAEAALKLVEELESKASYPSVDEYAESILSGMKRQQGDQFKEEDAKPLAKTRALSGIDNAKWAFVERRAELLMGMGRKDEAKEISKKFIDSLAPESTVRRTAGMSITRMELPGSAAPSLNYERGYGDFKSLEAWKGKVVIVDFFAHWCGPCIASFPDMKAMYADLKPKGLEVVAVTTYYGYYGQERNLTPDQEFGKMDEFIKKYELPWPVAFGTRANFEAYGISGIPTCYVIGKDGKVHEMKVGYSPESFKKFRADIEKLLANG